MNDTQVEVMAEQVMAPMRGVGLGAPFLATCFDSLLMGVVLCQMTHWIPMAKHDARHVRILVGIASTAALVGTAFTWATYMTAFVYEFGQYTRFVSLEFLGWYGTLDMLIVVPVQIFFAERSVRINNNNKILAVINGVLIAATASMGIATTISSRGATVFTVSQMMTRVSTAWPAVCTFTHIWLTSTILYGLITSRTTSQRANKILSRLIAISIESQLPSTIVAVVMMTILIVDHKSPMIPFIAVVHPKVFIVGMLAMVNLRHTWRLKGKVPTTYESSDRSRSRAPALISIGSTAEDIGVQTPKADIDEFQSDLSRHPSSASAMECGAMPMRTLRADSAVDGGLCRAENPF